MSEERLTRGIGTLGRTRYNVRLALAAFLAYHRKAEDEYRTVIQDLMKESISVTEFCSALSGATWALLQALEAEDEGVEMAHLLIEQIALVETNPDSENVWNDATGTYEEN